MNTFQPEHQHYFGIGPMLRKFEGSSTPRHEQFSALYEVISLRVYFPTDRKMCAGNRPMQWLVNRVLWPHGLLRLWEERLSGLFPAHEFVITAERTDYAASDE